MDSLISITEATINWATQRSLPLIYNAETESTNDDAKENAMRESADRVLYLADHQTKGRGRGLNNWLDTGSGESLLCTWSFSTPTSPQAITAPRVGLALFKAAKELWPSLVWSLKAPNDLFLSGRKMGGLLVECISAGPTSRILIGLGLNILNHPRRFNGADHLSKFLHSPPTEGEWFQFLDVAVRQFELAIHDSLQPVLSESVCRELVEALNANSARAFLVQRVTPHADLVHSNGTLRWTDL